MDFIHNHSVNKTKIIAILLFLTFLNQVNSDLPDISVIENVNPICFKMNNGNFLILNQNGLYVIDPSFSTIIYAHDFASFSVDTNDLQKTEISQFSKDDGENILVFVKFSIYFLSKEGKYISNFDISSDIPTMISHYILLVH